MAEKRSNRLDVSAIRESRDYRFMLSAGAISGFGSMVTAVAMPLQIAQLTGSYIAVGLVGIIQVVPLIIFGLWGGAIADSFNRKRVVIASEVGLGICSLLLLVNTTSDSPSLGLIYTVAFFFSVFDGLQRPSIESLLPLLLPTRLLASAGAINGLKWNLTSIAGPAVGGIIAATSGVEYCYGFDVVSYVLSAALLARLSAKANSHERKTISPAFVFSGLGYARKRPDLLGTYIVDIIAMVFAFPNALFPFIIDEFDAPWALGFLYSAMSVGSLVATLGSGRARHVNRRGRIIIIAAAAWGLAIALAGIAPNIYLVLIALAFAGGFDMVSALFRQLIWNTTIPLEMRGRLAGIELLSYSTGPQLGQIRATAAANIVGLRGSLITGGLLCFVGATAVSVAFRELWNFDDQTNKFAIQERISRHDTDF